MRWKPVVESRNLGSNSAFAKAIEEASEPQIFQLMDEVAREAETRADEIVAAEFNNGRSPDRRRAGPHLLGNFVGSVDRTPGGRVIGTITLRSRAAGVKVAALNYGSNAHAIGADGRWLKFPRSDLGGQYKRSSSYFAKRQSLGAKGGGRNVNVRGPIEHPGTVASHFLERALEQAVRTRLRTPVTIPRR